MEILPIHIDGDPILKQKCAEVSNTPKVKEMVTKMFNTLQSTKTGVGLAAPQVGLPFRIIIIGNEKARILPVAFINPEIIQMKGARRKDMEGCLSVPGVFARVERAQKIKIKYYDTNFNEHVTNFKQFEARVIQHEYDHLDGIEFYDRVGSAEYGEVLGKVEELRKGNIPTVDYEIIYHESHGPNKKND